MKPSFIPIACGCAMAAMSAAGLSHWWSVRQMVAAFQSNPPFPAHLQPLASPPAATPAIATPPDSRAASEAIAAHKLRADDRVPPSQKEFFEELLKEVKSLRAENDGLRHENRNIVDQVAETNRSLMTLQFQVDSHSQSFRPLPTSEDRPDTSYDDSPGVLPPRAEPVFPTSGE